MEKDADAYPVADMEKARNHEYDTNMKRNTAAFNKVASRPGIVGKAERAMVMGGAQAGRYGNKLKNKITNFVHDKIGLEE